MPIPNVDNAVKNAGSLMNLQKKFPVGFPIIMSALFFMIGNFYGRSDSKSEVLRLTKQVSDLQTNQVEILRASLEKNGIIATKNKKNTQLRADNDTLKQVNDTLSTTIIQVGEALLQAKKPAVKILNR